MAADCFPFPPFSRILKDEQKHDEADPRETMS